MAFGTKLPVASALEETAALHGGLTANVAVFAISGLSSLVSGSPMRIDDGCAT